MAIQINGNTVIDNSQNITNITDITASGTVNGGIVATTAEAQAASVDNVIMTPLKVKEAIQGGTISVIKSVQRFTLSSNYGGTLSNLYGNGHLSLSSSPSGATFSSVGDDFVFVNLPTTVNINKSFVTVSTSGVIENNAFGLGTGVAGSVNFGARLYNSSGNYAGNQVQIISKIGNNIMYTTGGFEIYVEVVEFY